MKFSRGTPPAVAALAAAARATRRSPHTVLAARAAGRIAEEGDDASIVTDEGEHPLETTLADYRMAGLTTGPTSPASRATRMAPAQS